MKNLKKYAAFLLALIICLSLALLAGCGSSVKKLDDTNRIECYGTIIRNGEYIDVCVTHDTETIYFYLDDGDYKLYDTAEVPVDEIQDDFWIIYDVDFADTTGDDNSDLQIFIEDSGMCESSIVWTWEEGEGFVYQPDFSWFNVSTVIYDPPYDEVADFSIYEGVWVGDEENMYDDISIEFDSEGNWLLYSGGELIDEGSLYKSDGVTYVSSNRGGAIDGGEISDGVEWIYISTLGFFDYADGSDVPDDDGDTDLHQRDVSEFEGAWYYEEDLSAETYIIIDGEGNWSYYQRAPGAEPSEMDYGTFSCDTDEAYTYYANSSQYDGVSYLVLEFDDDVLIWGDEGAYYRME